MKLEYRKGYRFSILEENEWIDVEVETYGKGKIKTVEIYDSRLIRYGIEVGGNRLAPTQEQR